MIYRKKDSKVPEGVWLVPILVIIIFSFKNPEFGLGPPVFFILLILALRLWAFFPNKISFNLDDRMLSCNFFSHEMWSIPISSIKSMGENIENYGEDDFGDYGFVAGLIIETGDKKYFRIIGLEDEQGFVKELRSKNSLIVIREDKMEEHILLGGTNKITTLYRNSKENKVVIIGVIVIIIFLTILYFYSPK